MSTTKTLRAACLSLGIKGASNMTHEAMRTAIAAAQNMEAPAPFVPSAETIEACEAADACAIATGVEGDTSEGEAAPSEGEAAPSEGEAAPSEGEPVESVEGDTSEDIGAQPLLARVEVWYNDTMRHTLVRDKSPKGVASRVARFLNKEGRKTEKGRIYRAADVLALFSAAEPVTAAEPAGEVSQG